MPATTPQKEALKSNCTFVCQIIKITAKDGAVVAFADHTRYLTISGTTYAPFAPVDLARQSLKVGLQPDSSELIGVMDDLVTEVDVRGGRWVGARVYTAFVVDYRDTSLGVVAEKNWFVGKTKPLGEQYTFELLSLSQALTQTIGEETSPTDRNRKPEDLGVSMVAFTHAATVTTPASTDRRTFTVNVNQSPVGGVPYFRYGRAEWLTGANAGLKMEIKENSGTLITLQLPMRSTVAVGDTLNLIAGYDGTLAQARDKFGAAIAFNGEPDLPGLNKVMRYPD